MNRIILATALSLLAMPAMAQTANNHSSIGSDTGNQGVILKNSSDYNTIGLGRGGEGGAGGSGGAGGLGGSATANGGNVTVSNGGVVLKRKPSAPAPTAPSIYSSAECNNAGSAAVTAPGFGVALGGTAESVGCNARQNFNVFQASGMQNAAYASMCMGTNEQRRAVEAQGVDCTQLTNGYVAPHEQQQVISDADCVFAQDDHRLWRITQQVCANR